MPASIILRMFFDETRTELPAQSAHLYHTHEPRRLICTRLHAIQVLTRSQVVASKLYSVYTRRKSAVGNLGHYLDPISHIPQCVHALAYPTQTRPSSLPQTGSGNSGATENLSGKFRLCHCQARSCTPFLRLTNVKCWQAIVRNRRMVLGRIGIVALTCKVSDCGPLIGWSSRYHW